MRSVLVFVAVCIALVAATAPLHNIESPTRVPDQYIVILHTNSTRAIRDLHIAELRLSGIEKILHVYEMGDFIGYSAVFSKNTLARVLDHPSIQYVEADQTCSIVDEVDADTTVTQQGATWGLDRIDQKALPLSGTYSYFGSAGSRVTAYIIDTGIKTDHTDFEGRAVNGINTVPGENANDGNGHGTHVASTVGGKTYGVAKKVKLVAVKVLNTQGSGTWEGVIAGVNYVHDTHSEGDHSVGNMSLGGGATLALDEAVRKCVAKGVHMAIAAGNNNGNACNYSPARVMEAIGVGATNRNDARSSFSNWGTCVDLFAPGEQITAAWITSTTATNTISGTSMAAPHVCGVIAVRLGNLIANNENSDLSAKEVETWLKTTSTKSAISNPGTGSPNELLYSPFQQTM